MKRALFALVLLTGCATSSQPVAAQLATACNSAASAYLTAAGYKAQGQLSAAQIATLTGLEPVVLAACSTTSPPTDTAAALASVTNYLQQWSLIQAGVKVN